MRVDHTSLFGSKAPRPPLNYKYYYIHAQSSSSSSSRWAVAVDGGGWTIYGHILFVAHKSFGIDAIKIKIEQQNIVEWNLDKP